jgi:hypothetical protein
MSATLLTTLSLPLAGGDVRCWEDEIVYVVIVEKFFPSARQLVREYS